MDKHNYSAPVSLKNIQVTDTFWKGEMELVRKEVIPYQWDALNDRVRARHRASVCTISRLQES